MNRKEIFVTSPSLPPLEEYTELLAEIWESRQLTNMGPFHNELEEKLADFLGVKHLSLFSNGTLALLTALQVLEISGEVITTPYTFVATPHALFWNNLKPVFCDVDPVYGNLDPKQIESLITPNTSAILPVHVYGNPADHEAIQQIAVKHNLKLIYDAAHAFGVREKGASILNYGDLAILSFHATKTFNTIEGGAVICKSAKQKKQIDYLKNFGFEDETTIVRPGINAKMNEFQAAFGLLQLKYFQGETLKRQEVDQYYRERLSQVNGIKVMPQMPSVKSNFSYFPIFITDDYPVSRDALYKQLKASGIYSRRYFYPLASNLKYYNDFESAAPEKLPVANQLAESVLCLPIYPHLDRDSLDRILKVIIK